MGPVPSWTDKFRRSNDQRTSLADGSTGGSSPGAGGSSSAFSVIGGSGIHVPSEPTAATPTHPSVEVPTLACSA